MATATPALALSRIRERILQPPPVRFSLVHDAERASQLYGAMCVRALAHELRAAMLGGAPSGPPNETLEIMDLWVADRRRHDTWTPSLWMELRDCLWSLGYPLERASTEEATVAAIDMLTGRGQRAWPLQAGDRAYLMPRPWPANADGQALEALLRWLRAPAPIVIVHEAAPTPLGDHVIVTQEGHARRMARTRLVPLEDRILAQRRRTAIERAEHAMTASEEWGPPTPEKHGQIVAHYKRLIHADPSLWGAYQAGARDNPQSVAPAG